MTTVSNNFLQPNLISNINSKGERPAFTCARSSSSLLPNANSLLALSVVKHDTANPVQRTHKGSSGYLYPIREKKSNQIQTMNMIFLRMGEKEGDKESSVSQKEYAKKIHQCLQELNRDIVSGYKGKVQLWVENDSVPLATRKILSGNITSNGQKQIDILSTNILRERFSDFRKDGAITDRHFDIFNKAIDIVDEMVSPWMRSDVLRLLTLVSDICVTENSKGKTKFALSPCFYKDFGLQTENSLLDKTPTREYRIPSGANIYGESSLLSVSRSERGKIHKLREFFSKSHNTEDKNIANIAQALEKILDQYQVTFKTKLNSTNKIKAALGDKASESFIFLRAMPRLERNIGIMSNKLQEDLSEKEKSLVKDFPIFQQLILAEYGESLAAVTDYVFMESARSHFKNFSENTLLGQKSVFSSAPSIENSGLWMLNPKNMPPITLAEAKQLGLEGSFIASRGDKKQEAQINIIGNLLRSKAFSNRNITESSGEIVPFKRSREAKEILNRFKQHILQLNI
ncbi:hypothetical protein [Agarilytica rhodophyticola]|uniref:hypothetical protein n=1 Tax=Agarilytica rhodophyticola TaxID=1737490 RepID=UPI000B344B70|nr:hypothetical protein [Agarilytica rhodophyticola]